jgi:hypothetical protein
VSHASASLCVLNSKINCHGLSELVVVTFFVPSIVFKYSLNTEAVSFNSSILLVLFATNFTHTGFPVGGHHLRVSIETISPSDLIFSNVSPIAFSTSKTFLIPFFSLSDFSRRSTYKSILFQEIEL